MKNTLRLILALTIYTSVWAQNDTALTKQQELKTNTLSFSALWGMFGFLHANYGRVLNDGKTEYQFMLGTFGYDDSYDNTVNDDGNTWESSLGDGYLYGFKGATGIKAAYRQYRKGNARGVFYQAHLRSLMLSWGYKSVNNDWKDVNTLNFESGAVLGYKYIPSFISKDRLFIELFLGANYSIFNPKDGNVTLTSDEGEKQGGNSLNPDLNLYIGFNF